MKKTKNKVVLAIFLCALICGHQYAQEETALDSIKIRKNAIGVSFGNLIGFDYSRMLKENKLYASISYNTSPFAFRDIEQEISGEELLVDSELDFSNIDIRINYHPFSNAFKIVAGLAFFSNSNLNVKTEFKNNISIGDIEFNAEESGSLDIDFNWSKTTPYLGIGFGRAVPRKRLGLSFDVGSYFSSSPEITLLATGLIEETQDQEELLNEKFKTFKFLPYATFRLTYSL